MVNAAGDTIFLLLCAHALCLVVTLVVTSWSLLDSSKVLLQVFVLVNSIRMCQFVEILVIVGSRQSTPH